jgi:hypothetical protein
VNRARRATLRTSSVALTLAIDTLILTQPAQAKESMANGQGASTEQRGGGDK